MGRPATGHKPVQSVRMDPDVLKRALLHAKAHDRVLGEWLEEAIREKIKREGNHGKRE